MTQPEKPGSQSAAPKSVLQLIVRLIQHCFRLWLLFTGLVLWWQVLLWDLVVCTWPLLMQAGITIGDLAIPIGITLVVLIPPLLFGLNWLAAVAAGFGLYGLAHWLLRCACWFWSLPLLPHTLGVVLAQTQSAGYLIETGQLDKAETLYEQARSTFNKSAWRFCSGAAFGFLHYRKLLKKRGREQEAHELARELRLPLLGQSACTALWFYSAAFIPMLLLNWFLRVYEDTNIKFYRDKPVKERLARLMPAVVDMDWFYLGRAKTLFYEKMGFLYESAHLEVRRTDPAFHLPVSARVNPNAAVRNSRADFLVEQYFWTRALETDQKYSGGAFQAELLDHLDYCNSKLKMATSASNFLLDKADLIKLKLDKSAEALQTRQNALESLVQQCLTKAREGDLSNRPLVEATAKRWLELNKKTSTQELSSRIQDNGLILAYVLTSYHSNAQALEIADCIAHEPLVEDNISEGLDRLLALADIYGANSEFARGRNVLREAAKMVAKSHDRRHASLSAKCDLQEAKLCFEQQDYIEAERVAARASQTLKQSGDNSSNQVAEAIEQQAAALALLPGKLEQAISSQEKCLELRTKLFGNGDLRTARTNLQLARMLRAASVNPDGSINKNKHAEIKRAGNILGGIVEVCKAKKDDNETALLYADTAQEAGYCARMIDDYTGAQLLFGEAAEIHMCLPGSAATRMQVEDLDGMAEVEAVTGLPMARTRVLTASGVLKNYVTEVLPQLSLAEQIAFNQTIEKHMNSLLAICQDDASVVDPRLLQAGGLGSMGGLYAPYSHLLHWKGFLLEQLSLRSKTMNQPHDPSTKAMVTRHNQVCQEIVDSYFHPVDKGKLTSLEQEKENLERRINEKTRNQVRQKSSASLDPRSLQSSLADEEGLIDLYEFVPFKDRSPHYGAVISTNKQLRWIDLGQAEPINQALNLWRDNLSDTLTEEPGNRDITSLKRSPQQPNDGGPGSWSKLRTLLAVPLSKMLPPTVKRVWISDESELCRLPWSVLLSDSKGMTNLKVCLVDSPRELLDLKHSQTQQSKDNKKLLLVGGIDYGERAPALPGTAREVDLISKEANKFNLAANILSDAKGKLTPSRQNVLNELVGSRYVHLATHGYFREDETSADDLTIPQRSARLRRLDSTSFTQVSARNPLIDSGLLLSSKPTAGGGGATAAGVLTAEDLLRTDLHNCKLVTLSACDTGRGRELSGQGVIGLRSALMGAGAHTVLLSLWKVPDEATTELMKVFYRELLSGKSASDSLSIAQQSIRSQERWRAPRYWAGWVIVGDGWRT